MIAAVPLASFLITEGIEGWRAESYDDATGKTVDEGDDVQGVVTIGPGLTRWRDGALIAPGSSVTYQEGMDMLLAYLHEDVAPAIDRLIDVELSEDEEAAFGSFLYNLGETKVKGYTLTRMINEGAPDTALARQWMKYIYAGGKKELGLYRRRMAEVLLWFGLDWRAALNVTWDDDVIDVMNRLGYENELDLFDDDYDPTPETPLTTPDLNVREHQRMQKPRLAITKLTPKVPVAAVQYLNNPEPQVKRIEDSQRGKGYAKMTTGQVVGTVAVGGAVADQLNAVEPVIQFAERYSMATAGSVFLFLGFIAVVWYFWGEWMRKKGEDEATDLLG